MFGLKPFELDGVCRIFLGKTGKSLAFGWLSSARVEAERDKGVIR